MTGSVSCDIVAKGRGDFRGVMCITVAMRFAFSAEQQQDYRQGLGK